MIYHLSTFFKITGVGIVAMFSHFYWIIKGLLLKKQKIS